MCTESFNPTDNEIRRQLLETLYNFALKETKAHFPVLSRENIQKMLNFPDAKLDFNIVYLEQKGLIELRRGASPYWYGAQITAFGIDVLQNQDKYNDQFPFLPVAIQEINGDGIGTAVQAVGSQVTFNQRITDAFQQALTMTEKKADLPLTLREEIRKHLVLLEKELKSEKPDAGRIRKLWKWLKRNAGWVVPTLTAVVLEGLKMAIG